jgi:NADH:ubiquinone oxidoreductase subunit 6 (subunit J)
MMAQLTLAGLSAVTLAGAAVVVFTRNVLRLVLGLGAFLLGVAGFYVYYGLAFIAAAQVFVYVGGVLVLVLFTLMLLTRDELGVPRLDARFDVAALAVAGGLFVLLVSTLRDLVPRTTEPAGASLGALSGTLLGAQLPAFELLGVLLLAGLVAVMAVSDGGGKR